MEIDAIFYTNKKAKKMYLNPQWHYQNYKTLDWTSFKSMMSVLWALN